MSRISDAELLPDAPVITAITLAEVMSVRCTRCDYDVVGPHHLWFAES